MTKDAYPFDQKVVLVTGGTTGTTELYPNMKSPPVLSGRVLLAICL